MVGKVNRVNGPDFNAQALQREYRCTVSDMPVNDAGLDREDVQGKRFESSSCSSSCSKSSAKRKPQLATLSDKIAERLYPLFTPHILSGASTYQAPRRCGLANGRDELLLILHPSPKVPESDELQLIPTALFLPATIAASEWSASHPPGPRLRLDRG